MFQAIVFLPLLGAIIAALISLFGAHARCPSGDTVEHHDDAHGHASDAHEEHADDHGHDDHGPVDPPLELQEAEGHGMVVEDAIPLAVVRERVVGAPCEVPRDAVAQGVPGRGHGACHRRARAQHQLLAPGKAQPPHLGLA